MGFRKPKKSKALQESWSALLLKWGASPEKERKLTSRSVRRPLSRKPTLMDVLPEERLPGAYPSASQVPLEGKPTKKEPRIVRLPEEEYLKREEAARRVRHCIMPGHKQGYEVVTDPEMIKQMGKKTA